MSRLIKHFSGLNHTCTIVKCTPFEGIPLHAHAPLMNIRIELVIVLVMILAILGKEN
jgi:hypothetical protein